MKIHVLVIVAILLLTQVYGVGVSPPRIILEDIPKGYGVEKSVTLSGIGAGSTITTSLSGLGSQWVQAKLGNTYVTENDQNLEFPFIINIPNEAPNGEYEVSAQIVISSQEVATQPNSATVSSGVLVTIKFTVSGKEIRKYRITGVQIPNTEIGTPVLVVMTVHNEGNVLINPSKVELTVKDKQKDFVTSSSTEEITSIEPYSIGESVAVFQLGLGPEFYFGDIRVHTEQGVQEMWDVPFDVFDRGSLEAQGELTRLEVQGNVEEIAKIDAFFMNKGSVDLYATLKAEVYKDGTLVDVFESDAEYVRQGDTKKYTHYYKTPSKGAYNVRAHVEFLGKESNTKEVSFSTVVEEVEESYNLLIPISVTVAIALLALLIIVIRRVRK